MSLEDRWRWRRELAARKMADDLRRFVGDRVHAERGEKADADRDPILGVAGDEAEVDGLGDSADERGQ